MSLQSVVNINVDFYDKKYILVNTKQLDNNSRFISVTCYNHGDFFPVYASEHSVYIRYKKPDNYSVFNFCEMDDNGKVIIELTEQMLSSNGICYADLVIVNKGDAIVDANTGEITTVDNATILSTMTFCIDVSETAIDNSDIESSYEINVLNETLKEYEAKYENVVQTAKSWAVGGTGIRDDETENNAKYYCELTQNIVANLNSSIVAIDNFDNNIATIDEVRTYLGI